MGSEVPLFVGYAFAAFVIFGQLMHHIDYLGRHGRTSPASATYNAYSGKNVKIKATCTFPVG